MKKLEITGLFLNLLGTLIMSIPLLRGKAWLQNDFIVKSGKNNKGRFWYERRGFRKIKCITLVGLLMLMFGFFLQLLDSLCR